MPPRSVLILLSIVPVLPSSAAEVRFNRDVRPILSKNCFACHGPDEHERKAELRLDTEEGMKQGGESGDPIVVPGKPEDSLLWQRIISTDPDEVMPPPKAHKELAPEERETLRQWILAGGTYEGHWAFLTPRLPQVPEGADPNPVDRFVAARLAEEGLTFSEEADRRTLARRLFQDLTGLPPTLGDLEQFLRDERPDAYNRLVERLLASPHFGERMALPWLDAARYADTNGYSIDGGRDAWLWRDWVIKAFNDNMPYDRFLVEQLAGDLLENPTESQLIATAFNRNHSVTHEGGTIPEENLVNYVVDRVKTTGEAILGITTGCGQCHDHKYDPFSQEDYYGLFAFFNTLDDQGLDGNNGVNPRPFIEARTPLATDGEIERLRIELEAARAELDAPDPEALADARRIIAREDAVKEPPTLIPLDHLTATLPNGDPNRIVVEEDESITSRGGDFSAYNVCCRIPEGTGPVNGMRVVFEPGPNGKVGFGGKAFAGSFVLNTITPCFSPFPAKNIDLNSAVPIRLATATSHKPGFPPRDIHDTTRQTGWAPAIEATGETQHITLEFEKPVDPTDSPYLTSELVFNYGDGASPAKFRIFLYSGNNDDSRYPTRIAELLRKPDPLPADELEELHTYLKQHSERKEPQRVRVANLQDRLRVLTEKHRVMVMNTAKNPRPTHFLERGVYSEKKHVVKPAVPGFLPALAAPEGRDLNRLDLARWLVRGDHPLTSRVAVNRFWQTLFGRGLVASSADFGSQGDWPSHPDLLDWLAVTFHESGWDVKALVRAIVTSRTYRQDSHGAPELLERDPENELLARGPLFRLPAEAIRDHALAISGLLVPRVGGPSVKPYHPGDLWRQVSHYGSTPATAQTYVQDHGEKLYRRSLYTYWKRTLPPPSMAAFDAPNREACTTERGVTNTPLQAFILMNDPQFVEASRAFAQSLLQTGQRPDLERLGAAFEMVTSRPPGPDELRTLTTALERERRRYQDAPSAAEALLEIGESPRDGTIPAVEHAAWTNLCSLLLNLSELVTRR